MGEEKRIKQTNKTELIKKFKTNRWFLIIYALFVGVNGISVAWTTGGNNQTAPIFAAKMNWSASEARLNIMLINFASQFGKAVGATYGGRIIPKGRKKVFIWFNILAVLSCAILEIVNLYALIIGKFLHGVFVTVVHICAIKMLNETVPVYQLGTYATSIQVSGSFGYLLVLGLGRFLPSQDYSPEIIGDPLNEAAKQADIVN
jgi:uncharacterized membrane protein